MAKKQAASGIPTVVKPASSTYFDKSERMSPSLEEPKVRRMPGKSVPGELKAFCRGWDEEIESILAIPESVFRMEEGSSRYYSGDESIEFNRALSDLARGTLSLSEASYGIAITWPSSTGYLLLVDMRRRIIVREPIVCMHDDIPQREWAEVKARIKSAIELAQSDAAKKDGLVAFFDGFLRTIKPSKSAGS